MNFALAGSCPACASEPVEEGGSVEGRDLYVYGSVVAVGSDTNGDTVRGTWARSGSVSMLH